MKYTRLSLLYLVAYLLVAGIWLLVEPQSLLRVMFSNVFYQDVPLRVLGVYGTTLGIVVVQAIYYQLEQLYIDSIFLRIYIAACLLALYIYSDNPLFMAMIVIVTIGIILTCLGYFVDTRKRKLIDS